MDGYTKTLVVILATVLAINLILWIIVLVKAIQILNSIKRISAKAENLAVRASEIGSLLKKTGGIAAVGRILFNLVKRGKYGGRKGRDE